MEAATGEQRELAASSCRRPRRPRRRRVAGARHRRLVSPLAAQVPPRSRGLRAREARLRPRRENRRRAGTAVSRRRLLQSLASRRWSRSVELARQQWADVYESLVRGRGNRSAVARADGDRDRRAAAPRRLAVHAQELAAAYEGSDRWTLTVISERCYRPGWVQTASSAADAAFHLVRARSARLPAVTVATPASAATAPAAPAAESAARRCDARRRLRARCRVRPVDRDRSGTGGRDDADADDRARGGHAETVTVTTTVTTP